MQSELQVHIAVSEMSLHRLSQAEINLASNPQIHVLQVKKHLVTSAPRLQLIRRSFMASSFRSNCRSDQNKTQSSSGLHRCAVSAAREGRMDVDSSTNGRYEVVGGWFSVHSGFGPTNLGGLKCCELEEAKPEAAERNQRLQSARDANRKLPTGNSLNWVRQALGASHSAPNDELVGCE